MKMARPAESFSRLVTAEELLRMPDDGLRHELVRGELRTITPAGQKHGKIAMRIGIRLGTHVEQHELGEVYAAETGFLLSTDPDTVRAPDASFVSRDRLPNSGDDSGFLIGAPDLAVDVLSPRDTFGDVEAKVFEWLDAGARMVVVVNPKTQSATVYRSRSDIVHLTEADELDGGDVVPGWRLPIREIFV
jgi:Uma2 family endonuclease